MSNMNDRENDPHSFVLPDAPPENYSSILHMRNLERIRADKAEPKITPEPIKGCCGVNCRECEYFIEEKVYRSHDGIGCKGCAVDGSSCEIRLCCIGKGFADCSECADFPCDMLKEASKDEDADNLMRLKSEHDTYVSGRDRRAGSLLLGAALGLVLGLAAGAFTGLVPQFAVCGVIVGTAVPVIMLLGDKNNDRR